MGFSTLRMFFFRQHGPMAGRAMDNAALESVKRDKDY
jgi:hypothetical protein